MKIASWNVNSLNVRLPHLRQWLQDAAPDIVGLQETKLADERFPDGELAALGYRSVFCGQKTYNGVAILARDRAIGEVQYGIPGFEDEQKRVVAATVDGLRIVNLYVVNGQAVGTDKYAYKLPAGRGARWLAASCSGIADGVWRLQHRTRRARRARCRGLERGHILTSADERAALRALLALG